MNVSRSALLPYTAAQMYAVVSDIRAYPEFLPWCESVQVLNENGAEVTARMQVAYKKLVFGFTTLNRNELNRRISLSLVDGPFRHFQGQWEFTNLESDDSDPVGCKVSLDMTFDFDRQFGSGLLSKMFEKIAITQLDAFQQRAKQLYSTE